MRLELEQHMRAASECLLQASAPILGHVEHHETGSAGAEQLASERAVLERDLVEPVDLGSRAARGQLLLEHPALVQQAPEIVEITALEDVPADIHHGLHLRENRRAA